MTNIVLAALSTGIEGGFSVIYDIPQDLWDSVSQIFDKSNVNKLLWNISGDSTATVDNMAPIEALAATRVTSADMIANYNKVNPASVDKDSSAYANSAFASANAASACDNLIPANDDYSVFAMNNDAEFVVTLGGLKWTPVFLSTTNEGKDNESHDVILTLWLADNQQDAWADRKADEGDYYGFLDGALYSEFAADWYEMNPTEAYPAHMYGTSYVRAVTLNNGGAYATSGTQAETVEKSKNSAFATFTMPEFGLTQYLVTPEQVAWQESGQSAKLQFEHYFYFDLPNENWGSKEKVPDIDFIDDYNYAGKEGNDAWKDDYLWLPSISETGYSETLSGIWQTSQAQRALGKTSVSGNVGMVTGRLLQESWLRSGFQDHARTAHTLIADGSDRLWDYVSAAMAVRPALHLNLTEVARSLNK